MVRVTYRRVSSIRLLSPEPMVVKQPQFTRVEEPTLLCNQVDLGISCPVLRSFRHHEIAIGTLLVLGDWTRVRSSRRTEHLAPSVKENKNVD
jgi:hypothetical protein